MVARAALSADAAAAWLRHLDYPTPTPGAPPVLLFLEGARAQLDEGRHGRLWRSPAPGDLGDLWEGVGDQAATSWPVANVQDEFNELGALLWQGNDGVHLGAFRGSSDPGSTLSRKTGWPHLGDGLHLYSRSAFRKRLPDGRVVFDENRPALRSKNNRCVREVPPQAGIGGDGHVTLSEVIARGMGHNGSILVHPGRRPTSSAGCGLTSGTYNDVVWRAVWGHTHPTAGIWVVQHPGADMLGWVAAGGPADWIPVLRPGANSRRWVRLLQRALGVSPDGVFGPQVASALLRHRISRGLPHERANIGATNHDDWRALGVIA